VEPISNADKILLVLRQRLEDRAKSQRRTAGSPAGAAKRSPFQAIRAVAAAGNVTERQLRRLVVQSLLADQFGETLLNESRFQAVVEQVTDALSADESASRLLTRVISELSAGATGDR
jgi:hypothetical protein